LFLAGHGRRIRELQEGRLCGFPSLLLFVEDWQVDGIEKGG